MNRAQETLYFLDSLIEQDVKMYKLMGKVDIEDFNWLIQRRGYSKSQIDRLEKRLKEEGLTIDRGTNESSTRTNSTV